MNIAASVASSAAIALASASAELDAGHGTSVALTQSALDRIAAPAGEGARAFTRVYADRSLQLARVSDSLRAAGMTRSPIEGLTVSVKDLFDVAGEPTTAGSTVLRDASPAVQDAAVVRRLLAAGAVLIGKTNMTEFAYSGLGINPHYGTPANPWDRSARRIPGGSSSGAGVAVADGMCFAGIGSDTGGSVRIPAALCGITGFKPTARRLPSAGMLPLAPSLDAVGVMAADVAGCAALDAVLSGEAAMAGAASPRSLRQARFAVPTTLVLEGMDATVAAAFHASLTRLSAAGVQIVELAFPEFDELAGFNAGGGFAAAEAWAWHAELIERSAAGYDPRVISRIRRGQDFSARAYLKLIAQRADWQRRVMARMAGFDALLMPTVPTVAPTIAELEADEALYFRVNGAMLRNPSVINFLDGCAISLPCQAPGEAPVGLTIAGLPLQDPAILGWAAVTEACLGLRG